MSDKKRPAKTPGPAGVDLSALILLDEDQIVTRHITEHFRHLRHIQAGEFSAPENAPAIVEAAVSAGILSGLAADDVGSLRYADTLELATRISERLAAVMTADTDLPN